MKRFLSSIFCLFIISAIDIAACQAQQRPAKLASIYFGKSKISIDDLIKANGKKDTMKTLMKQDAIIEEIGDWGESITFSYPHEGLIIYFRNPYLDYDGTSQPNRYYLQKNALGKESSFEQVDLTTNGVVYVNGIEVRMGDNIDNISLPKLYDGESIRLLDNRGGGIWIYTRNNSKEIISIQYFADYK